MGFMLEDMADPCFAFFYQLFITLMTACLWIVLIVLLVYACGLPRPLLLLIRKWVRVQLYRNYPAVERYPLVALPTAHPHNNHNNNNNNNHHNNNDNNNIAGSETPPPAYREVYSVTPPHVRRFHKQLNNGNAQQV